MNIVSKKSVAKERHPFGGCDKLFMHYRTIGSALCDFEESERSEGDFRVFKAATVFVPVEVLESYLEDLLDSKKLDTSLFIDREMPFYGRSQFLILGVLAALSLGLFLISADFSYLASLLVSFIVALPCLLAFQILPTRGAVRRLRLARVLSRLISKRRGRDDDGAEIGPRRSSIFARLVPPGASSSGQGAAFHLLN